MNDAYAKSNGNKIRAIDAIWEDFDDDQKHVTNDMVDKIAKAKGKYKYAQTDGLFHKAEDKSGSK